MTEAQRVQVARGHLELDLAKAVYFAREAGLTWTDIGAGLKVTRQAAFQRWGGRPTAEALEVQAQVRSVLQAFHER